MFLDKNGVPIDNVETCFQGYESVQSEYEDRDPRMTCVLQVPGRKYIYVSQHGVATECPVSFMGICSTNTGYRVEVYQ